MQLDFDPPFPSGFKRFARNVEVAGVNYHYAAADAFAKGSRQSVSLQLDPGNAHDPNAIAVIGTYWTLWTRHVHLGYVPAYEAMKIAEAGLRDTVDCRLRQVWLGDRATRAAVRIDLIVPDPAAPPGPRRSGPPVRVNLAAPRRSLGLVGLAGVALFGCCLFSIVAAAVSGGRKPPEQARQQPAPAVSPPQPVDPAVQAAREKEAARFLSNAKATLERHPAEGRRLLRDVAKAFPDTEAGKEAQRLAGADDK